MYKKLNPFLFILAAIAVFISSCDEIEGPYGIAGTGGEDPSGDTIVRKVLLEDFTGHTCQNCPTAHAEAKKLHDIYGDRLIIMAVHAGFFAKPSSAPFTADFRTQVATDIATDFGVINLPFPKGMVNRLLNTTTNAAYIFDYPDWEVNVDTMLQRPADAGITIASNFNSTDSMMQVTVDTKIINLLNTNLKLAVYFIEDSIVSPQKNGTVNDLTYMHRHMLRGSFNGTYGDDLGSNIAAGTTITKSYTTKLLPVSAVPSHVSIYAIVYDNTTKQVVQVEEIKLIP